MSYSFTFPVEPGQTVRDACPADLLEQAVGPSEQHGAGAEARAAISAILDTAQGMVEAVRRTAPPVIPGPPRNDTISVSISGHANPGREAPPSWSRDYCQVGVWRLG